MKTKTLYTALSISVLLLLSISIVTAGFLDKILGRDPDLSPVNVDVTLSNVNPEILKFFPVTETSDDINGATSAGHIRGDAGGTEGTGTVSVKFAFTAKDLNGKSELPGFGGNPILPGAAGNLEIKFYAPQEIGGGNPSPFFNEVELLSGTDCSVLDCANADSSEGCVDNSAGSNELKYTCNIDMNYFDPPSANIPGTPENERWTISVDIKDASGNTDTKQSGDPGFTALDDNYIIYDEITGVSASGGLSWSNLDINQPDTPADTALVLTNVGNIAVVDETVAGQNLVENGVPANFLAIEAFSVGSVAGSGTGGGTGACDAPGGGGAETGGIVLATPATVPVDITYSADGTDSASMHFCIWDVLNPNHIGGSPAVSYVANDANSNTWAVTYNS
jgi:hypothetical protein